MRKLQVIDDLRAIDQLIKRANGSLSEAARLLSQYSDTTISAQQIDQWRVRGNVAGHKRLTFLMAFNALPGPDLPLEWLATPAQRHNGGQSHGRKGKRASAQKQRRKGKTKRRNRAARQQLGASAA